MNIVQRSISRKHINNVDAVSLCADVIPLSTKD